MGKVNPEDIMDMAFQVSRHLRHKLNESDDHGAPVDKTSAYQTFALNTLMSSATTTSELADHMGITVPSATSLVDRLVRSGWVVREPDSEDRRIIRLRVTNEGLAICEMMKKKRHKAFSVLIKAMSEDDQQALYRILKNVHTTLEREKGE